jgi:hypothetical protein
MITGIDEMTYKLVREHYPTEIILESLANALQDQAALTKALGYEELAKSIRREATIVRDAAISLARR